MTTLAGCYQSHERSGGGGGGGGPGGEGGTTGPNDAATGCEVPAAATVRLEPPITGPVAGIRVVFLGASADPASNGVRIHLDTCGGMPPCPLDLIVSNVGNALARVTAPPGASGTLTMEGSSAYVHVSDLRDCASCGGDLDVLAGSLASGLDPGMTIRVERVACDDECSVQRAISMNGHGGSLIGSAGTQLDESPVSARVVTNYIEPCARCRCDLPPVAATGIVVAATGVFGR